MFEPKNPFAFIIRASVFFLLFSTFPLVNHLLRTLFYTLFWGSTEVSNKIFYGVNLV